MREGMESLPVAAAGWFPRSHCRRRRRLPTPCFGICVFLVGVIDAGFELGQGRQHLRLKMKTYGRRR